MADDIVAVVDIEVYNNEDFTDSLSLTDADEVAVDLTGKSAVMDIRQSRDAETEEMSLSTDDGTIYFPSPATGGILAFNLPVNVDTKLLDLAVGSYVYDCVLIDNDSGARDTIFRGKIKVKQGVTR